MSDIRKCRQDEGSADESDRAERDHATIEEPGRRSPSEDKREEADHAGQEVHVTTIKGAGSGYYGKTLCILWERDS